MNDFKKENARTNEQEEKENRKHAKRSFTLRVLVVLLLLFLLFKEAEVRCVLLLVLTYRKRRHFFDE